jgi:cyclophilin family peptidyl-prolyl cis-trans isomerase
MKKLRYLNMMILLLVANHAAANTKEQTPDCPIGKQDHQLSGNGFFMPDGIYADFNTNKGRISVMLDYKKAPMTVANFIGLAEGTISNASYPKGVPFFNGSIWHRVVKGHVIQGGSPAIDKAPEKEDVSATGYVIPNEISDLSHNKAGMLGMANSGPHTNTCQYYITLGDRSYLDGNYTIFGEVVDGMEVVNKIVQGDTTYSVTIRRSGEEAKKFIVNDAVFSDMIERQWKKVKYEEEIRKASDEKFITENYSGLKTTASGLRYKTLVAGKENLSSAGVLMSVIYTGRLINGVTFSSTADLGKPAVNSAPVSFLYNADDEAFIKGLKEGLIGMEQGEKRLLIIPSDLAYGENGFYAKNVPGQKRFVISPRETLILEVTLISFK